MVKLYHLALAPFKVVIQLQSTLSFFKVLSLLLLVQCERLMSMYEVLPILWGLLAWARIPSSKPLTTSQQPTQLSNLPRLVNEYSEVTLTEQAVMPQPHISCIATHIPSLRGHSLFMPQVGTEENCLFG